MQKTLRFYKTTEEIKDNSGSINSGSWFVDLPDYISQGGSISDCLMVAGAPELLDYLSEGKNEVFITVQDNLDNEEEYNKTLICLIKVEEENEWANYFVNDSSNEYTELLFNVIGLCPVNKFVWDGVHPDRIYITNIKN